MLASQVLIPSPTQGQVTSPPTITIFIDGIRSECDGTETCSAATVARPFLQALYGDINRPATFQVGFDSWKVNPTGKNLILKLNIDSAVSLCHSLRMGKNSQKGVVPVPVLTLLLLVVSVIAIVYYKDTHKPVVSTPEVISLPLALDSPSDGELITENRITVKGRTKPDTTVAFYSDTDENSVESDSNGHFESSVRLAEGINTLTVTAFDESGNEKSLAIDIVNDSSN